MKELNKWRQDERVIVYIDETHFDFRKNWGKGKAPARSKALCTGKLSFVSMSAITSITNNGPGLCHIHIKETINAARFQEFFDELLIRHGAHTVGAIRDPWTPINYPFRDPFPDILSHQIQRIMGVSVFYRLVYLEHRS